MSHSVFSHHADSPPPGTHSPGPRVYTVEELYRYISSKIAHQFKTIGQISANMPCRLSSGVFSICAVHSQRPAQCLAQKAYSIQTSTSKPAVQGIDSSRLSITKTKTPKELLPSEQLVFGRTFTGTKCLVTQAFILIAPRSYAFCRVDRRRGLVTAKNNTLSES